MSLNHRQQHQLYRIEAGLLRSDPKLAAMLGVFARLSAGQGLPAWEQLSSVEDRTWHAAALSVKAITIVAAAIGVPARRGPRPAHRHRAGRPRPAAGTKPERPGLGQEAEGRADPAGWS